MPEQDIKKTGVEAAKIGRVRNSGNSKGIGKIGRVNHNRASNVEG